MKVISLLQPWASLAVMGRKRIETRSWNTGYRGPLLIHASGKMAKPERELCLHEPFLSALKAGGFIEHERSSETSAKGRFKLPLGAIIGQVNLRHTCASEEAWRVGTEGLYYKEDYWPLTEEEMSFGNYNSNRWLWLLTDPVLFPEPIPAKGSLSLWDWDHEIIQPLKPLPCTTS